MLSERQSLRLANYDYSRSNLYFLTICVKGRVCSFGSVDINRHPLMQISQYGLIAEKQWLWLADQYPYIRLHGFVIMPNHIHGVLEIKPSFNYAQKVKPLPEIVGAYKTTVSKMIHLEGLTAFSWQRSFYDKIIYDEKTFDSILSYIKTNPFNWKEDTFYTP